MKQLKEEWRAGNQPNTGDNYHHLAEGFWLGFKTLRRRNKGLHPTQVTSHRKEFAKEKKELYTVK